MGERVAAPAASTQAASWRIVALIASVAVLGMLNSFTSKIRAQIFGANNYVVTIYNSVTHTLLYVLAYNISTMYGWVPRGQLSELFRSKGWRWHQLGLAKYLILAAASDVADNVTGFTAEPHLSTLMYSLMNQATVPFTVAFTLLVGVRYSPYEMLSVLVVVAAAVACVLVQHRQSTGASDSAGWAAFAAMTTSFAAISYLLKEKCFRDYAIAERRDSAEALLPDDGSDRIPEGEAGAGRGERRPAELSFITVSVLVNGISLLTCAPIVYLNRVYANSVGHDQMPPMSEALTCLVTCGRGAPLAFGLNAVINLLWNAALLLLTQHGSALLTFLALKLQVPLIALLSALPWCERPPSLANRPPAHPRQRRQRLLTCTLASFRAPKRLARRRTYPTSGRHMTPPRPLLPRTQATDRLSPGLAGPVGNARRDGGRRHRLPERKASRRATPRRPQPARRGLAAGAPLACAAGCGGRRAVGAQERSAPFRSGQATAG